MNVLDGGIAVKMLGDARKGIIGIPKSSLLIKRPGPLTNIA